MYSLTTGNVVILQKFQGHWCTMTLPKGQFKFMKNTRPDKNDAYMGVSELDAAQRVTAASRLPILT